MKKFIFGWAILLLLAGSTPAQTSPPADTGTVSPQQPVAPPDTGTVATPKESAPTDTGAAAPSLPASTPADTATGAPLPADTAATTPPPADTSVVLPPPTSTDTGAVAIPPQEIAPKDTAATVPQEITPPADTGTTVTPPPEAAPTDTAATLGEVEVPEPKVEKRNRLGLGIVFNDEAPVSIRAWFNPKVGLDAGIGLKGRRVDDTTTITDSTPVPATRVTMLDLSFDLGIPIRILRKEKVDFILRPGFGFRTRPSFEVDPNDTTVRSIETTVELEINGSFGFEYYPFEKVSFSLSAGVALVTERTGGEISNTIIRLQSLPSKKGVNFAFRYYAF